MIDKRTEASVNYAEILARGPKASSNVEEPAAATASWNAPSMNMAAAMASLIVASAAKETAPMLTGDTFTAAADFATNKAELAAAENTVASMQPGPQKTAALTVLKNIDRSKPADVKSALNEIMRILEEVKSREVGEYNTLAAREQAAAEREARIRELRAQIDGAFDEFEKKGYITKKEREESEDRQRILDERQKRIDELQRIENPTDAQKKELVSLIQEQKEDIVVAKDADTKTAEKGITAARNNNDLEAVQTGENTLTAIKDKFALETEHLNDIRARISERDKTVSTETPDVQPKAANVPTNPLGVIYNADPTLNAGSTLVALNTPKVNDGKEGQQVNEANAPGW